MRFRKDWTPHEADEWTIEDYAAMVLASLSYFFLTIGVGLCFLLPLWGLLCVFLGGVSALIMYRVIDPKLRTISEEYEKKQKEYLAHLDKVMKWEEI